jgi:hypothetical protein
VHNTGLLLNEKHGLAHQMRRPEALNAQNWDDFAGGYILEGQKGSLAD